MLEAVATAVAPPEARDPVMLRMASSLGRGGTLPGSLRDTQKKRARDATTPSSKYRAKNGTIAQAAGLSSVMYWTAARETLTSQKMAGPEIFASTLSFPARLPVLPTLPSPRRL